MHTSLQDVGLACRHTMLTGSEKGHTEIETTASPYPRLIPLFSGPRITSFSQRSASSLVPLHSTFSHLPRHYPT